jgi:hypothetical protein
MLASLGLALSGCGDVYGTEPVPEASPANGGSVASEAPPGGGGSASAESPNGGSAPAASPTPIRIAGRWGLFFFEDPIAVEIVQTGSKLSGLGCDAGLPTESYNPQQELCGPLVGEVVGNRAWFEFALFEGSFRVRLEVTIAADASRLSGLLGFQSPPRLDVALLPLRENEAWLPSPEDAERFLFYGQGSFELREASDGGTDFQPDQVYELRWDERGISGDLGVFWHTEMSSTSDVAVLVGPVSASTPGQPISLTMDQSNGVVNRVVAVTESGASYVFGPATL